jgi:hypothetical protein
MGTLKWDYIMAGYTKDPLATLNALVWQQLYLPQLNLSS